MKLFIKTMVCSRCKMVVKDELIKHGLHPVEVELGEVEISEELGKEQLAKLDVSLQQYGFALIDDKRSRVIEKVKTLIVDLVQHKDGNLD
ncbi:MAG: AraC family transcriptional regulator, partial [Bacteroidetes bacterium]|nr:AraC family transcriptional regulator [Bacteroidota bacterium]